MDDSCCVLVELINEGNTVAVGFRSWISPELSDDELQDVITKQEIVVINWPDCNLEPAIKMLKRQNFYNWQKTVVKILSAGSKYISVHMFSNVLFYEIICKVSKHFLEQ